MPDSVILAIRVDGGWNHYELERGGTRPISWKVACHRCGHSTVPAAYKTLPSSSEQHTLHMLLLMTLLRQYHELFLPYPLARRRAS